MNKLFTVSVAALALGLGLMGCDLLGPTDADEVSITLGAIPAISSASNQAITGDVDANVEITSVTPVIKDASGTVVSTITVTKNNVTGTKKKLDLKTDLALTLGVSAQTCNGTYTLELTAMAGTATTTKSGTFTVSGVKDCSAVVEDTLSTKQVTLGNQNASAGSALDVDLMEVYKSAQFAAASVQATIDLWFGIVSTGAAKMMAPSVATGFAPIANNWTTKNATKILKVTADFNQIKTQSQIDLLWSEASSVSSVEIAANDVFVIKTVEGKYRLLRIVSASTSESGTAEVVGRIK